MMKRILSSVLTATMALAFVVAASTKADAALIINYSNVDQATINFDGAGNFSFPNVGTWDFSITSETGGSALVTLLGNITGTYAIGAVTISGPLQTAPVTGTGTFTIFDGVNTFSSSLTWVDIFTLGATGGLNAGAAANLTNFVYAGTNADLLLLKSYLTASNVLTFQFSTATTLTSLKSTANSTSYSGTVTGTPPVPEPASMAVFGLGMLGAGIAARRRRRA
jgi:PEP-CTERM motif